MCSMSSICCPSSVMLLLLGDKRAGRLCGRQPEQECMMEPMMRTRLSAIWGPREVQSHRGNPDTKAEAVQIDRTKEVITASHAATPSLSQAITHLFGFPSVPTSPASSSSAQFPNASGARGTAAQSSAITQRVAHARTNSQPKSLHNPFLPLSGASAKRKDSSDLTNHVSAPGHAEAQELSQYPLAGSQELAATPVSSPNRRTSAGQQQDEEQPLAAPSSIRNANLSIAREEAGGALLRRQSGPAATQSSGSSVVTESLRADSRLQARHHSVSTPGSSSNVHLLGHPSRPLSFSGQIKEARGQD